MWRDYLPLIFTIICAVAAIAGQWGVLRSRMADMSKMLDELRLTLTNHTLRTDLHVDPVRDQQRWDHLMSIVDRIDKRMDRLFQGFNNKDSSDV